MTKTDLTNTQRAALAEITRAPGRLAKRYPGGVPTVQALMRRGLVEVQGEEWKTFLPAHEHSFSRDLHLDGCHFYETQGRCECGVQFRFTGERSLNTDDYAEVWMEQTGPEPCARCEALRDGARPKRDYVIARPENYKPDLKVVA